MFLGFADLGCPSLSCCFAVLTHWTTSLVMVLPGHRRAISPRSDTASYAPRPRFRSKLHTHPSSEEGMVPSLDDCCRIEVSEVGAGHCGRIATPQSETPRIPMCIVPNSSDTRLTGTFRHDTILTAFALNLVTPPLPPQWVSTFDGPFPALLKPCMLLISPLDSSASS